MRSSPVARLVPASFRSSCRLTSKPSSVGPLCAMPSRPAGRPWMRKATTSAEPICSSTSRGASPCSRRGASVSRYSERRRWSRREARNVRSATAVPRRASIRHWENAPLATVIVSIVWPAASKIAAKAASTSAVSRSAFRLCRIAASAVSRVMFCRSTAIFVHATSRPGAVRSARPVQNCGPSTSDAA